VSHLLDVVERLATRVILIDRGHVRATLTQDALKKMLAGGKTLEDFFLEQTRP